MGENEKTFDEQLNESFKKNKKGDNDSTIIKDSQNNSLSTAKDATGAKKKSYNKRETFFTLGKCIKILTTGSAVFNLGVDDTIGVKKEYINTTIKEGQWYWFKCERGRYSLYRRSDDEKKAINYETAVTRSYKKGYQLLLRLKYKQLSYLIIETSPGLTVKVRVEDLPESIKVEGLKEDEVYRVIVLDNLNGKIKYNINGAIDNSIAYKKITDIRESFKKLIVPRHVLAKLKENAPDRFNALNEKLNNSMNEGTAYQYILECYKKQEEEGTLYIKNFEDELFQIDLGVKDAQGVPIAAEIKNDNGKLLVIRISSLDALNEISRHVNITDWKEMLDELEEMALPEKWYFSDESSTDRYILQNYIRFAFYKARIDNNIIYEAGYALFNTGLVDKAYDEIYCLLEPDSGIDGKLKRPWRYKFFACRGKGTNGKLLNKLFSQFPVQPKYIDHDHLKDVIFDTTKELYCDYDHIIGDNLKRLPSEFIKQRLAFAPGFNEVVPMGIEAVSDYLDEHPELSRILQEALESAVNTAVKYCKWNYKTAIPIYYARTNKIDLLLPLILNPGTTKVDIALVVERLDNGNYQGQTILDLKMAYLDARLICRPNSEWLIV